MWSSALPQQKSDVGLRYSNFVFSPVWYYIGRRMNVFNSNLSTVSPSPQARVRGLALLPGEQIVHVFSPHEGLIRDVIPAAGRLLVATNQRLLSLAQDHLPKEVAMVPLDAVQGVIVKTGGKKRTGAWFQGIMLAIGGIVLYLLVGYWLAGRFQGPSIPVINVDLLPLVLLILIAAGVWFIGRYYFSGGSESIATFQAGQWVLSFPCRGEKAEQEIFQVVHGVMANRNLRASKAGSGGPQP
ncbi:MAG: hypothetical protein FJ316_07830 [SAR202 cluster bacterium]|nr:hypothetical protein [SAR202 cluster bacterium]